MIPERIFSIPRFGFLGYHPTLLPSNRGRHPIIWTIALGLKQTGSSFFRMNEFADEGLVISQRQFALDPRETATTLYRKLEKCVPDQLREIISESRYLPSFPGISPGGPASSWRRRARTEGTIDWRMAATEIDALVRSLTWPYSGAVYREPGREQDSVVRRTDVWEGTVPEGVEPGRVLEVSSQEILVACGSRSAVWLRDHDLNLRYKVGDYLV